MAMRRAAVGLGLALHVGIGPAAAQNARHSPAARLDHVILIVRDLDSAAAPLTQLGFRFKPGRLHANNLVNRHIKFRDGTGIELMALAGPPKDSMAIRYGAVLERGEGGAYVALRSDDLDAIAAAAERLGLATRRTASGPWSFLGFAGPSDPSAVFFTSGGAPANDPDSMTRHRSGALALTEAWVEGGPLLDSLLLAAGGRHEGPAVGAEGRRGARWRLASGRVVVVRRADPAAWPRPLGVTLGRTRYAAVPPLTPPPPHRILARPHQRFARRLTLRPPPPPGRSSTAPRPLPDRFPTALSRPVAFPVPGLYSTILPRSRSWRSSNP